METQGLPGLSQPVEVGRGGYGVVYRAWQEDLRRYVAVKVLALRLDSSAAARFRAEGMALGSVSGHPHIVAVHEAGTTADGAPYLVMPFCAGGSLADRLRRDGPVSWQEVLDIGVRLAGALQTAHSAGILHRDIKPGNILLDDYGNPQLADFGQARKLDTDRTATGTIAATPAYTAPELLRGAAAGAASDVYSLAATMLALLLGHAPFARAGDDSMAAVIYRVVTEAPDNLRGRGIPDPICRVLEWALSKDPRGRPATAAAFGQALQDLQLQARLPVTELAIAGDAPTVSPPTVPVGAAQVGAARPRRRTRVPWLVGAAVVLVAVLVTVALVVLPDEESGRLATADPESLLLVADDYGIKGLQADARMPEVFRQVFGAPQQPRETDLAACLRLPISAIQAWQPSAMYVRGTPIGAATGDPAGFVGAQSAGLVMDAPGNASAMVEQWSGARFDLCKEELISAGIGLLAGRAFPVLQEITFTDLDSWQAPAGMSFTAKRASVPLKSSGGKDLGKLIIDVALMSDGSSVSMTVVESFPEPVPPAANEATFAAMAGRLAGVN